MVDPTIIHKYSLNSFRPVSIYYKKMIQRFLVLGLIGSFDVWFCSWFFVGHGWWSVIVHVALVAISVPGVFILLYHNSSEFKYVLGLAKRVLKRKKKRKK